VAQLNAEVGGSSLTVSSYPRWGRRLTPLLLLALTLAVFLPALDNGFVNWDDDKNLLDNPHYRGLGWAELRWMWTSHLTGHYIPITWMSLGLDYVFWGMDPIGYHLTNLILHAANTVLFYLLALLLLHMSNPAGSAGEDWGLFLGAGFAALFFALHPLRVESVVWVTERRDVLSGLFCLLATLAYLRAAQQSPHRQHYLACLILFVLALLSKEIAVTLPGAFVVLDIFPLRRLGGAPGRWIGRSVRGVWLEKMPFFLLSLTSCAATWLIGLREGTVASLAELGWLSRIEISIYGLGFYVRKTLAPVHLSPMYALTKEKFDPAGWPFILSAVMVVAVTATAILCRRRYPAPLAVWLVYGLILLPVVGTTQNGRQIAADRYSYLACLGWALLGGVLVQTCWRRWGGQTIGRTLILGMGTLALGGLGFLTSRQVRIWKDSETLWTYVISSEPCPVAYENLGMELAERGDFQEALENFQQALRINPNDAEADNDMGATFIALGKADEAILHFRKALRSKPNLANSHYGLGYALFLQGKLDEAINEYQAALRLKPEYEAARRDLDKARTLKGKPKA
jgi:protein O-mannosyl-transferase